MSGEANRFHIERGNMLRFGRIDDVDCVIRAIGCIADVVGQTIGRPRALVTDYALRRRAAAVGAGSYRHASEKLRGSTILR